MAIERYKEADLKKLADKVIELLEFREDYEYGAPGLDQKRPFGSSISIEQDIFEIIGLDPVNEESNPQRYEEQIDYARSLFMQEVVPYIQRRWKELNG